MTGLLVLDSCGRDLYHAAATVVQFNTVACACFSSRFVKGLVPHAYVLSFLCLIAASRLGSGLV